MKSRFGFGAATNAAEDNRRVGHASKSDLLLYIADMLAELESMAAGAKLDAMADLLAYTHREAIRNQKMLK